MEMKTPNTNGEKPNVLRVSSWGGTFLEVSDGVSEGGVSFGASEEASGGDDFNCYALFLFDSLSSDNSSRISLNSPSGSSITTFPPFLVLYNRWP